MAASKGRDEGAKGKGDGGKPAEDSALAGLTGEDREAAEKFFGTGGGAPDPRDGPEDAQGDDLLRGSAETDAERQQRQALEEQERRQGLQLEAGGDAKRIETDAERAARWRIEDEERDARRAAEVPGARVHRDVPDNLTAAQLAQRAQGRVGDPMLAPSRTGPAPQPGDQALDTRAGPTVVGGMITNAMTLGQALRDGERTVMMEVPGLGVNLRRDDHSVVHVPGGIQQVPEHIAGHWYLKAAGVKPYDPEAARRRQEAERPARPPAPRPGTGNPRPPQPR